MQVKFCEEFWVEFCFNSVFWLEIKGWFFSQSSFSLEEKVKIPLIEVCEADWLRDETASVVEKVPVGRNAPKQFFQNSTVTLTSVDKTKLLQCY